MGMYSIIDVHALKYIFISDYKCKWHYHIHNHYRDSYYWITYILILYQHLHLDHLVSLLIIMINPNPETALIPDIHIGIRHHQVYSVSVVRRQTTDATNDLYTNKGYADSAVYNLHLRYTRTTRTDEQAVWRMPTAAKYEHVTHG